jgi:sulfotransferase 6B1
MYYRKIRDYIAFKHRHPVFVNSIPKCGTNLVMNLINSIPYTKHKADFSMCHTYENPEEGFLKLIKPQKNILNGDVYVGHVPYSDAFNSWLKKYNFKHIFVIRDPRDYIVSLSHYVTKDDHNTVKKEDKKKHAYYDLFMRIATDHLYRYKYLIKGYGKGTDRFVISPDSIPNVKIVFGAYQKWLKDTKTLTVPFESIINKDVSPVTMKNILTFLEQDSSHALKRGAEILQFGTNPSKSRTFRKGEIGGWKNSFDEKTEILFNDFVGTSLNDFMVNNKL